MAHVLIIHEVVGFRGWKTIFDQAAGMRRDAGELSFQVLRDRNAPDRVVHFSRWRSIEAARAFFESPRLVRIREEAGVRAPGFIYLDQAKSGVLQG